MNIFGFPGNPLGPLNPGLQDQRLAIEWVHKNIANFHGDPDRITLFGQSAGAGSIDHYSYAYAHDPIVAGIILESGSVYQGIYPPEWTTEGWHTVSSTLNCGDNTTDSERVLECMRQKTTEEISAAIPLSSQATGSAAFWPTIDEKNVFSNYSHREAAKVPMLIGSTDYEVGYYKAMAAVYNHYLSDEEWFYFQLAIFTCPASVRSNDSVAAGNPTWRYRYFGSFEELRLRSGVEESAAYHASEVLVLWGTTDLFGGQESEENRKLGRFMRKAWARFAKNPEKGLERMGWPEYETGEKTLLRLGWENKDDINLVEPSVYDGDCALLVGGGN